MGERDSLSLQVIKKKEQVRLQIQKIKIMNFLLKKAEGQYDQKDRAVQEIRDSCRAVMEQIDSLKREIVRIPEMLIDLNILEKEYTNEKIKTNYLREELRCPTNVHIWRKLESTDKKSYDLIIKLQTL